MSAFDWDDLRYFLAVARAGRLTVAARRLGADHTTVSRRLASLEAALQAKLFERKPQGYGLTEQGERLLAKAESMESQALAVSAEVGGSDLALSGTVRVGAPDGFGTYFLAPELGRLAELHPNLTLQLVALPRVFSLSKREADIAITLEQPTEGRLVSRKLTDYRLRLYASKDYLDRQGPVADQGDLRGRLFVTYVMDLVYSPVLDYFGALEKYGPRRYEVASVVAQLEAVRAGVGIGILHDYAARQHPDLRVVLPDLSFTRTYWLVTHAEVRSLQRIAEVHDFIVERVKAQRGIFV
ncbi:LysR family transcriptional regulator [Microvirga pudoricolor]|uniref:LysR family transcriptional regulator n=1 Tax=Microvirga pudoricolor TaxID=2778729 RepID=UPI001950360B|nr:LysR family transcriptional regulator [Microvirga pudoricolor]MBM6594763.1 LysR family transcriptional regulator [Microvirga pudoricolor]